MKHKILIFTALAGLISMSSCSDFLEQKNTYQANEDAFFDSNDAVSQGTSPLYNYVWNSFNGKFYYSVGDGRSNNLTARWRSLIQIY